MKLSLLACAVSSFLAVGSMSLSATNARAENLPAHRCEIYVKSMEAQPNSHGSGGLAVVVKVSWLGDGETIQNVGFYRRREAHNLGNDPAKCHIGGSQMAADWSVEGSSQGVWAQSQLALGEYLFSFPIYSGSVENGCNGYGFASVGAFYVQTNRNTYWVNPAMDKAQYFYFDENLYNSLIAQGGAYHKVSAKSEDFRAYNPLACEK